jgi:hypothetical protein
MEKESAWGVGFQLKTVRSLGYPKIRVLTPNRGWVEIGQSVGLPFENLPIDTVARLHCTTPKHGVLAFNPSRLLRRASAPSGHRSGMPHTA